MAHQDKIREESRAGDGVELTVTQARAGVRRGVSKILVISTALTVIALAAAWLLAPRPGGVERAHSPPPAAGQVSP